MLSHMTMRNSLMVGACLFIGAWFLPGIAMLGMLALGSTQVDGWGAFAVLALSLMFGLWLQGMMMGAGVLLPVSTYLKSQNPALSVKRIMVVGLALWAIPAVFVAPKVTAAVHAISMKRYTQADCKAGLDLYLVENGETAAGGKLSYVQDMTRSPMVLSHLKIALDGDPPRATPLECFPLRKDGAAGVEEKMGPGTVINSSCVLHDPAEPIPNVKATILEAACDGAR